MTVTVKGGGAAQALRSAADRLPDDLAQLADRSAQATKTALQDAAPISKPTPDVRKPEPGGLRRSIAFDLAGTVATFTASQVAEFVIAGTEAHDIRPRGDGYPLHFYWEKKGGFVNFMRVRHPGTKPNDFRQPALEAAADEAAGMLEEVVNELLGRLGA